MEKVHEFKYLGYIVNDGSTEKIEYENSNEWQVSCWGN